MQAQLGPALAATATPLVDAVANAAALRLRRARRTFPAWTAALGPALCLGLALPPTQVLVTVGVVGAATVGAHRTGPGHPLASPG